MHSDCPGGPFSGQRHGVVIDRAKEPLIEPGVRHEGSDILWPIKCNDCGAPLGVLANVENA